MWYYFCALLAGIATLVYWYLRNQFLFWERLKVPFVKPHWPYGSIAEFAKGKRSAGEVYADLYRKLKSQRFGGIWNLSAPSLLVCDPELLRDVLIKNFGTWPGRGISFNEDVDPLSAHMVNFTGKKWKSIRTKMSPTFSTAKLRNMHYLLLECGNDLKNYLESVVAGADGNVEARDMGAKFTTDVIGSCGFGIKMNSLNDEDAEFRKMGRKIFELTLRNKLIRTLQLFFPGLFKLLKIAITSREITDFFVGITKETFEHREKNNIQKHDFMDLLRNLRNTDQPSKNNDDDLEYTDELLAAQAFLFFSGGFETSSTTIGYCLHELAVNKNVQKRLRDEIEGAKASANGEEISWDALKNMTYLDMVVQETLRKYPPFPILVRVSEKPYEIPRTDIVLPSGTHAIVPIYGIHNDPDYFPEPEKFIPERFTEEAKSQRQAFTYLPFGGGPRLCIAQRLAEQMVKLAIFKSIENFEFSLRDESQARVKIDPRALRFLEPENGVRLRVTRIS
ncbi:probable cytochrome P450 6a14 [Athalia rosae]|uniref:probable cytochrome P450 6a14 n=1 Tax=Athalia rosae TaxID=37344 RepID=UPI0020347CA6|nr:probable cytochrome P450 6a14 [Athalia rosae]